MTEPTAGTHTVHSTSHTYLGNGVKIIVTDRSNAPLLLEVFEGRELIVRHDLIEHAAIHLASSLMRAARRRTDEERIAHVERDLAQTRDTVQALLDRGIGPVYEDRPGSWSPDGQWLDGVDLVKR